MRSAVFAFSNDDDEIRCTDIEIMEKLYLLKES